MECWRLRLEEKAKSECKEVIYNSDKSSFPIHGVSSDCNFHIWSSSIHMSSTLWPSHIEGHSGRESAWAWSGRSVWWGGVLLSLLLGWSWNVTISRVSPDSLGTCLSPKKLFECFSFFIKLIFCEFSYTFQNSKKHWNNTVRNSLPRVCESFYFALLLKQESGITVPFKSSLRYLWFSFRGLITV